MKFRYKTLETEDIIEDIQDEDIGMAEIEIILTTLDEREKKILKLCSVEYEYIDNSQIKLYTTDFINFSVEIDKKNEGIFLQKSKNYYEYFENNYFYEENPKNRNLIISKEGVRVELIFI
ncbi:hypothetical protein IX329_002607 [Fusobacterium necrophorum]|uniref:Uncharacterized protein n=2 Tax=Fusobacterium TaxID=848 RepID=A0A017H507_9FUSO|nr:MULTISPECIES: hypothetical protein [Fusobacterium]EYD69446.1 hypothetical protein FNF_04156 [Fusobacterium necrophorum subsp. funduliforme B35]KID48165.1 hypothetical protein C095_11525 [Fusobacterium necrophorum subsp. funduliforme B35]KXA16348.1 hypothetical protein HMPREF3206_00419 [Fusobacterium equinum]MBR8734990.1 hypothetical protein [Fusobacterium necrophorum]MBR8791165.1 hypothetical protein [Fusobacterium necrophorum]